MDELIKVFRKLMVIFTVVVTIITYISIYLPIKNELYERTLDNFVLTSQEKEQLVEDFMKQCLERAKSFSGYNELKSEIVKYKNGTLTLEELIQDTETRYLEKAGKVEYLDAAYRVIDKQVVNQYGRTVAGEEDILTVQDLWYTVDIEKESVTLQVYSPIFSRDMILGYDTMVFELNSLLDTINQSPLTFSIITGKDTEYVMNLEAEKRVVHNKILKDDGFDTHYIERLDTLDCFYYIRIKNNILFADIRRISFNNLIGFSASIILLILLTNWITIKMAQKILVKTEKSKEKYKEYATRDSMTGVYSRLFFEQWMKDNQRKKQEEKERYIVVMIDIDDFKAINDTYGHHVGDKAVKMTADILKNSLREDDFVIRYGGDEFLLFMKELDYMDAERILKRIIYRLEHLNELQFPISISYGIQEVTDLNQINQAIEQADDKMYMEKKRKRRQKEL